MPLEIIVEDDGWKKIRGLKTKLILAYETALPKTAQVKLTTLLLSNDETIAALNQQWRGKSKPTNVLSFPAAPMKLQRGEVKPLGDIILSYETCAREADEAKKTLRNHAIHLAIHGMLHLIGYDHETDEDADKMEAKEIKFLSLLGISNPYLL